MFQLLGLFAVEIKFCIIFRFSLVYVTRFLAVSGRIFSRQSACVSDQNGKQEQQVKGRQFLCLVGIMMFKVSTSSRYQRGTKIRTEKCRPLQM